jgi:hypothetical protein
MRVPVVLLLIVLLASAVSCRSTRQSALNADTPTAECSECRKLRAEVQRLTSEADRSAAKAREMTALVEQIRERLGADGFSYPSNGAPVDAVVSLVDEELNFVQISIGMDDELDIGEIMLVYRGNEYVGKLIIDKKGDDWASGHMDLTKTFPKKGDSASSKL